MDHNDRFASDSVDDVPDPGVALYLFTTLATELLLGRPLAASPSRSASGRPAPDQAPSPEPTPRDQSAERHQPSDPHQVGDRYRPRADAEQRDLAQALLRVVSALAHLGATARAYTAAPMTTPRPVPPPGPHTRPRSTGTDRQWRRWLTVAAVTVALGVAFRPHRTSPVTNSWHCARCAR